MTDAQQLFDYAVQQFNEIADHVDRHFDLVTNQLKEWLPTDVRIYRAPPPPPPPPATTLQSFERWILTHKRLVAASAFIATGAVGGYVYVKMKQHKRRRRARRSGSGARTDVVVVAGSLANPLTNSLCLDLERRGFIVYVVASNGKEEYRVRSQNRIDLLPLRIDLVDPFEAQSQLSGFRNLLEREHKAFDNAEPHKLQFAGLILIPDTQCSPMHIEDISSEEWSDALNAKVLNTIATTQLFLPAITEHKAKVLLLTPSVAPTLRLPAHALETTVYGALEGFASCLASELKESGGSLTQFKLGSFEMPSSTAKLNTQENALRRLKNTPIRRLHDSVFDALISRRSSRTMHVGRGALEYDIIGGVFPPSLVAWMMGFGRKPNVVESEDMQGSWEKIENDL